MSIKTLTRVMLLLFIHRLDTYSPITEKAYGLLSIWMRAKIGSSGRGIMDPRWQDQLSSFSFIRMIQMNKKKKLFRVIHWRELLLLLRIQWSPFFLDRQLTHSSCQIRSYIQEADSLNSLWGMNKFSIKLMGICSWPGACKWFNCLQYCWIV